jgi:hypothetical protein
MSGLGPKVKTAATIRKEKLYTEMQYHLTWRDHPAQDENEEVFASEQCLLAFINKTCMEYPDACFEVFYGRKVKLKEKLVIASYEVERVP